MVRQTAVRIAILGICLESNHFAPVTTLQDFRDYAYCVGGEILESMLLGHWIGRSGAGGFVDRMSQLRDWTPVPILVADAQAGGPCDHADYLVMKDFIVEKLRAAMPIHAVYIVGHGAGTTTRSEDLDGDYFRAVRDVVGIGTPIVATLDLHGNVSNAMHGAVDVLVSQRTNPHLDCLERAAEAAELLDRLLRGEPIRSTMVRLPLVTPQVAQLTTAGTPYGELIDFAQLNKPQSVASVSVLAGFAFSDTSYNGMAMVVAGTDRQEREAYAQLVASQAWSARHRYQPQLISVAEAVAIARRASASQQNAPLIFADVGDNPGDGGSGNTMWLIEAFYRAGIQGVLAGAVHAPEVVAQAEACGPGGRFKVVFNRHGATAFSKPFEVDATVVTVRSGDYLSTAGIYRHCVVPLGRSCVLQIGGLQVVVVTIRQQLLGADCFAHFGLDCTRASCIIAKSKGHFQAGFSRFVPNENMYEVDAPGLTAPNLAAVGWKRLPRHVFPIDPDACWPGQSVSNRWLEIES